MSIHDNHNPEALKATPVAVDTDRTPEALDVSPRFVLYGQFSDGRYAGSGELSETLIDYLHDHNMTEDGIVKCNYYPSLEYAFFWDPRDKDEEQADLAPAVRSVPLGVFVFPYMRDYIGAGITIATPVEEIEALCKEHNVPMVVVNKNTSMDQIGQTLAELSSPTELPSLIEPHELDS